MPFDDEVTDDGVQVHWLRGSHPTPLVAQSQHHPAMAWEGVGQS